MKTAEEIYADLVSIFTQRTGFSMDSASDLSVRLYAAAAEIESLYVYSDWVLRQCFPQTATGEQLDCHGALRGLSRKQSSQAVGTLRFSITEARADAVAIAAGTVCSTTGLVRFVTTQAASIPAGSLSVDVSAQAETAGAAGNAAANTVTVMVSAPAGVSACTNPAAFSGGTDTESDEAFRARVIASFVRLPNGANAAFYELRALANDGVASAQVIPRVNGIGTVGVVIASHAGVPDQALIAAVQADLDAVREIAVDVTVSAPTAAQVDVTAAIKPIDGVSFATAQAAVESAIRAYFTGERLGKPVYCAAIGGLIYGTGLVENYSLSAPTADLSASPTQLPVLGTLAITEAE